MQNNPPFNNESDNARPSQEERRPDAPIPEQNGATGVASAQVSASSDALAPTLSTEIAQTPTSAEEDEQTAVQSPQTGAVPVMQPPVQPPIYVPPPGFVPVTPAPPGYALPPGSVPTMPPISSPGYPQPGYIPPSGYIPQPGYTPPPQMLPPGYMQSELPPRPPRPRLTRDKVSWLAIGGAVLAFLVLLGIILSVASRQGSQNTATTGVPTSSSPSTSSIGRPTSAFQAASCPFETDPALIQSQQVNCGYVTVPVNRRTKDGKKAKLAVAIFKASQYINSPDPAPVIRLDGGPGGPSLSSLAQIITSGNFHDFIFNHNVVMFDQRGTGYSTPSLNCPELLSYQGTLQGSDVPYEQATRACYNRLIGQGIDLNSFNSLENAADVADIIHALGYQQMTIYGVSYGTRLALTTMRLYPSVVRASVLDSVYPPNHSRVDLPSDAQRVFSVLFQGCAKNPTCNKNYPNLQNTFYALVDQLNAKPISFYTVDATTNQQYNITFAGDDLIGWTFSMLYVTSFIPVIPKIIFQIKAHNYFLLADAYGLIGFDDTLSQGLFYSATCSEDWAFSTAQNITQSEQGIEPHLAKVFGQEDEQQEYNICKFWRVNQVPLAQKQPVTSAIPTLITTGEYDPITPPANGQEAAKTLSNSYFFEFPGQGHGQLYSSLCSDQIISTFEDNPTVRPDGSCINQMLEPAFL